MKNKLARQITIEVALVIFGGMLVCAAFQHLTGEAGPVELIFRHLWHSVVLGILVYGFLLFRLRSLVLFPLNQLFYHAHDMAKGVFQHEPYQQTHNEIDEVTSMMNRMAEHMKELRETDWKDHADAIELHLEQLREIPELPMEAREELEEVRDSLQKLDVSIMRFVEAPGQAVEVYGKAH